MMSPRQDPYKILGVPADADAREIKKAFRALARECHPDVAGQSPEASERFLRIRAAYELLMDPGRRARHDRRARRQRTGTTTGPGTFSGTNDLDLEDIFGDYGGFVDFGFGGGGRPAPERPETGRSSRSSSSRGGGPRYTGASERRQPGADISIEVDVPSPVALRGGSVTVTYFRRAPGDDRVREEIATLRVPPGTRHGQRLRVPKMGHAGSGGGHPGDLVCEVILRQVKGEPVHDDLAGPGPERAPPTGAGTQADPRILEVSVPEALLGGRVLVETPGGRVALTLRPCTPGGKLLRVKGRGAPGPDGAPTDHYVQVRIIPPETLDEESRRLIERFADRNP